MATWLGYAIGDMLLVGLSAVIAKYAQKKNNANLVAMLWSIMFLISVIIVMRLTGTGQSILGITMRSWIFLLLSGGALGAALLFLFRALKTGEVIKIVPVFLAYQVLAILLRMILFHTEYSLNKKIAAVLLVIGTVCIALHAGKNRKGGYHWLWYSILSAVCEACSVLIKEYGVSGANEQTTLGIRVAVAIIVTAIATTAVGGKSLKSMTFLDGIMICLSGAAAGGSLLCYHRALSLGPENIVIHMDRLSVLAVLVMGCIFLRERLSFRVIIGYLFVTAGVFFMLLQTPLMDLFV